MAGVPTTDVLVEGVGVQEHTSHIGHMAGIPTADMLVENNSTLEHVTQIRHPGKIGAVGGLPGQIGTAVKSVVHGCPFARAPLLDGQQFQRVCTGIEVYAREARAAAGVILDAHGVGAGGGVIAGVVTALGAGFIHTVVVAVHIVVIGLAGEGGDGELGAAGGSIVVRFDGDDEIGRQIFVLIRANVAG